MGKVYLLPAGVERQIPGGEPEDFGPEADDPALTLEDWRARIRRHPGELKSLLKNQAFIAGIGNAYSDEILHRARLLPFRKRSTLSSDDVDNLYEAMREVLPEAIGVLRERVPPTFETQVRDFLAVHNKGRAALSTVRDEDHADQSRRVYHVVLPRLPSLTPGRGQGSLSTWPTRSVRASLMLLSRISTAAVVPKRAAIADSVSPDFTR
jgi:ribosomal protein S13